MSTMTYKDYSARIEFRDEDGCFIGRVAGIRDIVTFHGDSVTELRTAFEEAVDDYLDTSEREGLKPQRPYSGDDFLRFQRIIYIGDLLKRWPGAAIYKLRALIANSTLTPYRYEITEDIDDYGNGMHVCDKNVDMQQFYSGSSRLPDFRVVFSLDEVERLEEQYPRLKLGKTKKVKWGTAELLASEKDQAFEQWKQAIARADIKPLWRVRLEIMLKRKAGEKVAALEAEYARCNIPRDVTKAKKHDVPVLKRQFSNLPDLG